MEKRLRVSIGSDNDILDYARLLIRSKHKRAIYTRLTCNEQWKTDIQELFRGNENIGEIRRALNAGWNERWEKAEKLRFSSDQEEFFDQLRTMTKYHMFQRAGGVATNLMDDDGNMISDSNEINQMIKKFFEEIHTALNQDKLTHQEK